MGRVRLAAWAEAMTKRATKWTDIRSDFQDYVIIGLEMESKSKINSEAVNEAYRAAIALLRAAAKGKRK